jgi:PAS domain S-box-containing protein
MTGTGPAGPITTSTGRSEYGGVKLGLIIVLIGLVFVLDSILPRGIPVWILYLIPLLLSHQISYLRAPSILAACCAGLTFLAYFISPDLVELPAWVPVLNRLVGVGIFSVVAYAIDQQKRITHELIRATKLEVEHEALQLRERLLAKNAEELQDLYDHAPCGYHSLDPDGLIIAINQTELDWLGYGGQEILGKKRFIELLTAPSAELFTTQFPILIQEGHVNDLEFEIIRKHGSRFTVLLSATAMTDLQGRFVAGRFTLVDITDRKRADEVLRRSHEVLESEVKERTEALRLTNERLEQELITTRNTQAALKSTERRFQLMADHAPVLIWISDLSKGCVWFNKPWLKFVGRDLEQELGNGWAENVHPDDLERCLKVYESSFDARQEFAMEYRLRRHDGEWRWLLDHGLPRYEADDVFAGFIGSCIDITEHKNALAAARESEERLSGMIGSAMDAIITVNERQDITHFNAAAEAMFGCAADQAIGRPVTMFIPARFRSAHTRHVAAFGQTSDTKRQMGALGTIYGLRTNGNEFPIEASISQVRARGQKLLTVILRDISHRKQAEDALRASEARFRELLECLPQLVWTCLPEGRCDYLSPQWVTYTGIPAEQQLDSGWLQQLHPDDRQATVERWQVAVSRKQLFEIEFRIRGADNRYRWFHTRATPIHDEEGHLVKWLGTNTDIDDRKRAAEVQARLGAIIESSSDAIISQGLDGFVLTWNHSAEQMFGYPADEIVGRQIRDIVPIDRRQEESLLFEEVKAGKQHRQHETLRQRKDATSLYVSLTISPIKDAKGAVIGVSTIARDITARKRAEETMEQQLALLELSHEPIFAWDMQSGIVEWNRGCEQLYGHAKSDALNQSSHALLHTVFPCPLTEIHAALESAGKWTGELRQRTKDGQDVLVDSRWGLLKTNGRSLVLETNRDITQRKRFEETILKKNKDLETLLYVTSHDLKEPLRAIESFSVLIQERYTDRLDEKGKDFLRRIVRATQRLDQLLTDILNLSRAQRMDPPTEDIESELLVQEVLRRLESRIKETNANITIRSPLPRLRVNATWAIQGIYNLLTNALKFVRPGQSPEIEIASHAETDAEGSACVGLVIRDRGPGVPPEHRERIFDLFKRAVGREVEGTGAGLAIVRQVAERHGGRAWIAARKGGGAEFFITFGAKEPVARGMRP